MSVHPVFEPLLNAMAGAAHERENVSPYLILPKREEPEARADVLAATVARCRARGKAQGLTELEIEAQVAQRTSAFDMAELLSTVRRAVG